MGRAFREFNLMSPVNAKRDCPSNSVDIQGKRDRMLVSYGGV